MFKRVTTNTKQLSEIVDKNKPLNTVTNKLVKRLKGFIHECFRKVKIVDRTNKELELLYHKRRVLRQNKDEFSQNKLEEVENELSSKYSDVMANKVLKEVKGLENDEEGGFNSGKLWKLKKKLSPRVNDPPCAMRSSEGKLLTSDEDITKEAMEHYKKVFKHRNIEPGLEDPQENREKLCQERLRKARDNKTPAWTYEDVKYVLKHLKNREI